MFDQAVARDFPAKYESLEAFLDAYDESFSKHLKSEQVKLFQTANWMCAFFNYVPAKKNKGLILQVIPKLVEGSGAKYITGSGQTQATKDRVFIYELEGGVKPFHRGRERKASIHASMIEQSASKLTMAPVLRTKSRKQRRLNSGTPSISDFGSSDEETNSVSEAPVPKKRAKRSLNHDTTYSLKIIRDGTVMLYGPTSAEKTLPCDDDGDFTLIDLGTEHDATFAANSMKRSFSWGTDLVGADSYLAYQEKFKDEMHAFPQLLHSQISVENLLFSGELIGATFLEDDNILL